MFVEPQTSSFGAAQFVSDKVVGMATSSEEFWHSFASVLAPPSPLGLFLLTIVSFGLGWLPFVFSQLVVVCLHLAPEASGWADVGVRCVLSKV